MISGVKEGNGARLIVLTNTQRLDAMNVIGGNEVIKRVANVVNTAAEGRFDFEAADVDCYCFEDGWCCCKELRLAVKDEQRLGLDTEA
jgi:hypothetical protein